MVVTTQTFMTAEMLAKAEKYFSGTKYWPAVKEASDFWENGQWFQARDMLASLPSEGDLLKLLVEKLRGKSVCKTLKKIEQGIIEEGPEFLKGLFSLGTHIAIEVEHGNREYRLLYPLIYEKLGEILYND